MVAFPKLASPIGLTRNPLGKESIDMVVMPELSAEQKLDGLKKAQQVRMERAKIRAGLKDGSITLADLLARTDEDIVGKTRVKYVLESLPQVGKITAARIMQEVGIDEVRRLKGLGVRQREELLKRMNK